MGAVIYTSFYHHSVDPKRRVMLPAKWRPTKKSTESAATQDEDDEYRRFSMILWKKYVWSDDSLCLLMVPSRIMNNVITGISKDKLFDDNLEELTRLISFCSADVEIDSNGRFLLPEHLARQAGIENEVVLVGLFDKFQIWNPKRLEMKMAKDAEKAPKLFELFRDLKKV